MSVTTIGPKSLSNALDGHRNSFGLIRLTLAIAVIVSHAFPLGGFGDDPTYHRFDGGVGIGTLAVIGFFAISGYVITQSSARGDLLQFTWRRALRIAPAFWAVLIVGGFVLAPIVWVMSGNPLSTFFTWGSGGPFWYVADNAALTINQWSVHEIFLTSTPFGLATDLGSLNGSLWTLRYEVACYVAIGVLAAIGAIRGARFVMPAIAISASTMLALNQLIPDASTTLLGGLASTTVLRLVLAFFCGATLAVYADRIPMRPILGLLAAAIAGCTLLGGGFLLFGIPAATYALFWVASALPRRFQTVGAKNDYSYGVYLYGWPVQQFTAYLGWNAWGYFPWLLTTVALACACAWLSWHGLEKQAMRLKSRGPGRGAAYWMSIFRRDRSATPAAAG